ncbi:hypothetical protein AGMMS49992_24130 [Clostridia bacterium]|nr:hypothetical protein AGMMS49992_24130 [Clostridia bacterium]
MRRVVFVGITLLAIMVMAAGLVSGEVTRSFSMDGVFYEVRDGELWIAGFDDEADTIVYRDSVDGMPVHVSWNNEWYYPGDGSDSILIHEAVDAPAKVKMLVIAEGVTKVTNDYFREWETLESVSFPSTLRSIQGAFIRCTSLRRITLPEGVESVIGSFMNCGLTEVHLPASLTSLNAAAFGECNSLMTITVDERNPALQVIDGVLYNISKAELLKYPPALVKDEFVIPSFVKSINDYAIAYSSRIRQMVLPEGITVQPIYNVMCYGLERLSVSSTLVSFGDYINDFGNGVGWALERIDIAPGNPVFTSVDGVVYKDGKLHLYPEANRKSLYITDEFWRQIEGFGETYHGFFYQNYALEGVAFDTAAVTEIPNMMFSECINLKHVSLPLTLTKIGDRAFDSCISLESVALPPGLLEIGDSAFTNTPLLKSVIIPDSVSKIGDYAFDRTTALICRQWSAAYWYAYEYGNPWASSVYDTPRAITNPSGRTLPAAVINGPSGGTTKLLANPRANANSLGFYPNGTTVIVLDNNGSYAHVRLGGMEGTLEGYIPTDTLVMTDELTSVITIMRLKNKGSYEHPLPLTVYTAPLESSAKTVVELGVLDYLHVVDALGVWYQVVNDDRSVSGYVRAQDAHVAQSHWLVYDTDDYQWGRTPYYFAVTNPNSNERLNLRERPDSNSPSMGRYYNGTIVERVDGYDADGNYVSIGEWVHVKVDGKIGYMRLEYLSQVRSIRRSPYTPS